MKEPEIILESWSPCCDVQAFVEKSESCYYFYLWFHPGKEEAYIKSCWIANACPAPEELNMETMDKGTAPPMPRKWISHNVNGIQLNPKNLTVEWFEEGDGAALMYRDDILCVIPGWGGLKDFSGYAKYIVGMTPFAWEITDAKKTLRERIHKSHEFWNYLGDDFWRDVQQMHLKVLEDFFGTHEKYYAIDGGNFPPKALITGRKGNVFYGITAGVSLLPMPLVEQYFQEDAQNFRRIELGFAATEKWQDICPKMYSFLSSIACLPWNEISFLGHGHTIPCNVIQGYSAIWLLNARVMKEFSSPIYPEFNGDEVNLLWVVPVKQEVYETIIEIGTDEMLKQIDTQNIHIFN
ncbi:suppressor of fused domain protein [Anaerocolumna sp.]|uniref:suppressor of fused domain protein n=1 Tax=Anaerocolumna sp. TaxID=2041569 RepID=UPI0028B0F141|nr:suppressor of fused domain protein [Anaerocolumna sp.]